MQENIYQNAKKFIQEYSINGFDFIWDCKDSQKNSLMINIPDREVYAFDAYADKIGADNFNDENGRKVNVTNWSYGNEDFEKCFFYDRYFPIVNSTWNHIIIKIDDNLYATLERGMVYEWDDLK